MNIVRDYRANAYRMEYRIGAERIVSYLDINASNEEYNNWKLEHKLFIRQKLLNILVPDWINKN